MNGPAAFWLGLFFLLASDNYIVKVLGKTDPIKVNIMEGSK